MQVASWLLVQRAIRDGEMRIDQARDMKFRLSGRDADISVPSPGAKAPDGLTDLIARAAQLYARVKRLDESMYAGTAEPLDNANSVNNQIARLQAAFTGGRFGAD
jgi:regulator of CtrA degradation